eukprot:TRINITY_DN10732_c0_g1_i1.p1 TRINITY_DN10732_c0_g1~~TRINITY_DN10732_c0_g1_i1.p1  ORF type:complete len:101 (-),score=10.27 TRINITY_DN10732_c0_g1_i1:3-305(-)
MASTIENVPKEVQELIISQMDRKDLISMSATSTYFHEMIEETFWAELIALRCSSSAKKMIKLEVDNLVSSIAKAIELYQFSTIPSGQLAINAPPAINQAN